MLPGMVLIARTFLRNNETSYQIIERNFFVRFVSKRSVTKNFTEEDIARGICSPRDEM